MQRLILFSQPTDNNNKELLSKLFPKDLKKHIFAYMPSNGSNSDKDYSDNWKKISEERDYQFIFIDNMKEGEDAKEEIQKLNKATVLLITGGNTFELLRNLKRSGLDKAIEAFRKKIPNIIAGFSAGAIVLTPTISVASQPATDMADENLVELTDLTGLNLVNFEVFPHYHQNDNPILDNYRQISSYEVKAIDNDSLLIIDK